MLAESSHNTKPNYVCANSRVKLIGSTDGMFPDFGHHLEGEMGGLWLYPIKLLDGFWMRFKDKGSNLVDHYISADRFENYPHKNVFHYDNGLGHTPVRIVRSQIAPDDIPGILLDYEFMNQDENDRNIEIEFLVRTDLRPGWLSEELGIKDGRQDRCEFLPERGIFHAWDEDNPWHVMVGSSALAEDYEIGQFFGPEYTQGAGVSIRMRFSLTLPPYGSRKLVIKIAGSCLSEEDCRKQYEALLENRDFEKEKLERLDRENAKAVLKVDDADFENIYEWIKVHKDWLTLSVDGIGRGIVAGLPEYPWWFGCDSCYTLQAILAYGDYALCRDTLKLILDHSARLNGNGRIIHELLPDGYSPNLGNTQETAHFLMMLWDYFQWTGDREFLEYSYPYCKKSVRWLNEQDEDGDYFPSGYGLIEINGLNMEMIDTAVYTCEAYRCYGKIAEQMGEDEESVRYILLADKAKEAVNRCLWDEENGLYCDCHASFHTIQSKKGQIEEHMQNAHTAGFADYFEEKLKERSAEPDREYGWLLNLNWVINTPMETGIAPAGKAEKALKNMHTDTFIGRYGMYLEGMDHTSMMTISTGAMAVAQARYGYADRALELIRRMFSTFSMATPGSISEMSPDYGCFVQAWTAYGAVVPVVRYFFGIRPDAEHNQIYIEPCMPKAWEPAEGEYRSILSVPVLDGEISVSYTRRDGKPYCRITNTTSAKILSDSAVLLIVQRAGTLN